MRHVSYTYPESKSPAVKDVNLDIAAGSWTTILGPNGSGKSTLMRLIDGLLLPDDNPSSQIIINGQKLQEDNLWQTRSQIGIVFQNPDNQFVGATVGDDVAFGLENRGVPRAQMLPLVAQAVKEVGMDDYLNAEPANLSGGQKQRVAIAGILAIKPQIIILDEATSMLDPQGKRQILKLVQQIKEKNDLTVISITHDIDEAALADVVLVLNQGQVVSSGSPTTIFQQTELIRKSGLEEPFIFRLMARLKKEGIAIPATVDNQKKLVKYLCQLNLKM